MNRLALPLLVLSQILAPNSRSADRVTGDEALSALRRAVGFFCGQVSTEGGCLWLYSADLAKREGEGKAGSTTVWVQPPGTPSVGMALLDAYEATGERACLDGAVDAARALVVGQLDSGGWNYRIEFATADRRRWAYRTETAHGRKARNSSVLDDNTTQAAIRLLMRVDRTLGFEDDVIHTAARQGLTALLGAQFASGGWPQVFEGSVDPSTCCARPASLPEEWSRSYSGHGNYWHRPTLNDNLLADVIDVLFEAATIYREDRYRAAAIRGGEFILLAQLPEPQPGWAQQYSYTMQPRWARKFEPPAVTGGEARGVIVTLMDLFRRTGDRRWLEPVPRALEYYRRSRLPSGRLARFYELGSNRPLYFTKDYQLTYDGSDVPTHYAFTVPDWVPAVARRFEALRQTGREELAPPESDPAKRSRVRPDQARSVMEALDARGAWVEEGRLRYHGQDDPTERIISCRTFIENLKVLANFVAGEKARTR